MLGVALEPAEVGGGGAAGGEVSDHTLAHGLTDALSGVQGVVEVQAVLDDPEEHEEEHGADQRELHGGRAGHGPWSHGTWTPEPPARMLSAARHDCSPSVRPVRTGSLPALGDPPLGVAVTRFSDVCPICASCAVCSGRSALRCGTKVPATAGETGVFRP